MTKNAGNYALSLSVLGAVAACGGSAPEDGIATQMEAVTGAGGPIAGLTSAQISLFNAGATKFAAIEAVSDGLGPTFNEKSCGTCHSVGAEGGSGVQFEVRAGILSSSGFNDLASQGGQLFQLFDVGPQIPGCPLKGTGEPVPSTANEVAHRRTTSLFGLGLVDATPDATFVSLAASEPSATRGVVSMVTNLDRGGAKTVGKFGWKAQVPTLHQFAGDAYLNEMGITNPQFPNEDPPLGNPSLIAPCDKVSGLEDDGTDIVAFTNFMQMLAPPPPAAATTQTQAGSVVFTNIGCNHCHTPTLTSGSSSIAALANKTYHPYSDFLLHDMGSLADHIGNDGSATPTQMRTAPLWGLRFANQNQLLHDGRANTIAAAIQQHAGQGAAAAAAFNALSATDQKNLVAFLGSL